jgi:hypothetical protein
MKHKLLTSIILVLLSFKAFGLFTESDITITTKGIADKYAARFTDSKKKAALVSVLNELRITHDIAPIKITVTYADEVGEVIAEINYDNDKIFSNYSDYSRHNRQWSRFGNGISVYLQHQIFTALSEYKRSVATSGYTMDKDLLKFGSTVKCKKANGDWVSFYAYNYFDSRGFYPYSFYKNVDISVAGKVYDTETSNTKTLDEMKFFMVGKTTGIDGGKTGAYYFCKFFNMEIDKQ